MSTLNTNFIEKFKLKELTIKILESWVISLRPEQPTIGSLVLSLNRHCEKMADLQPQETLELEKAFKEIDRLLEKTFFPDKLNYLALMMVDNQVHFHIIPRYKEKRIFNGIEFFDENWPKPPVLTPLEIEKKTLFEILEFFKRQ